MPLRQCTVTEQSDGAEAKQHQGRRLWDRIGAGDNTSTVRETRFECDLVNVVQYVRGEVDIYYGRTEKRIAGSDNSISYDVGPSEDARAARTKDRSSNESGEGYRPVVVKCRVVKGKEIDAAE